MGHPSERDPAPEPHTEATGGRQVPAPRGDAAGAGPGDAPYEPRVRLYEEAESDGSVGGDAPGEPEGPPAGGDAPDGSGEPAEPDDVPYQPRVRQYEQQSIATVAAPATGAPTQALPTVPAAGAAPPGSGAPAAPSATGPSASGPSAAGPSAAATSAAAAAAAAEAAAAARTSSPLDPLVGDGAPSRAPKVALWAGIGVVVLAGAYAGAQWAFADTVPQGTTVADVEIGGLGVAEATSTLDQALAPRAAEPVAVAAGDASSTFDPADAGLALDSGATVDELTGFSLSPVRLWEHLVGGGELDPVVDVDTDRLAATIDGLQETLLVEPVDGTVSFDDGEPVATKAADGSQVVVDEAVDVVASGWLVSPGPYELPTEAVEPAITQDETDAALAQAEQVVSGPVKVSVGDQTAELPARALARATSFKVVDGALEPQFDGDRLVTAVVDRTSDLLTEPDDAHFEFSGGKPVVVGGDTGTTLKPKAVASAVGDAALGEERETDVELVDVDPDRSADALKDMGVKEVVSSFSTPITNDAIRTKNLERGAQLVTGTLVAPGETFSLLDTLSPIDTANGFYAAGVVSNGVHKDAVGGGLSQMATTTYNAGYFAGFDDAGHRPHSYWFSRYPAGREATIYVGVIDMKFTNDTPYGAVMQSWVSGGELHVAIWSTPYYDVKTSSSGKQNVVPKSTVHNTGAGCAGYPGGNDGFTITNYRQVFHDGEKVKDESFTWTYKPDNAVVCDDPEADRGTDRGRPDDKPEDGKPDDAGKPDEDTED
ncbi:VanW family protein [Isoptericola sp. BMS4]|uniref:VanW family protein n=1 Tax=Isoptericola sp. BMS4 TaxID=2527875 RepID=UPI001420E4EF|nr:VanW family protein [Isoptericola sp. BMS4]